MWRLGMPKARAAMTLQHYLTRLLLISTLPLWLLAAWFGVNHLRDDQRQEREEAEHLLESARSVVEENLRARLAGLQTLAASPLADTPQGWPDFHREARGYLAAFGSHVALIDAQRRSRVHTMVPLGEVPPPAPRPVGRSAVQQAFEQAQPAVGDRFQGTVANEALVGLATPGLREGRVEFVVGTVVPLRQIEALLASLPLSPGWELKLLDSRGAELAVIGDPGRAVAAADDLHLVDRLALAPWTVEVRVPQALSARNLYRTAAGLAALLLGATVAAIAGGYLAGRRLARSVRSLSEPPGATAPVAEIREIRDARALIDSAAAQRDRAEALQRETELHYRERLEHSAAELRQREAQWHGILESASDAIVVIDAAHNIVLANPTAARIFGQPDAAMAGVPVERLFPPSVRAAQRLVIEEAFGRGGGPGGAEDGQRLDLAGLRADGAEFPIEATLAPMHIDGRPLCTVVMRDVSQRRQAEAALLASKARLEATLESMSDALFITAAHGELVETNSAFARMHGFADREECRSRYHQFPDLIEAFTADGKPVPVEQWAVPRALRGESATNAEFGMRRRDSGRSWYGSYSFAPIRDPAGTIIGAVVTGRDVTESKQLQAELQASQAELRSLMSEHHRVEDNERRRIARELHDELQQVLVAIKMEVAAIERHLAATEAQTLAPMLDRIDQLATAGVTSTRRIVNDLRPLMLEELGLVPALEALCQQFQARTGIEANVEATSLPGADGPLPERVEICLYRVAQESLTNVAKHSAARRAHIGLAVGSDGTLTMRVHDDGQGFQGDGRHGPQAFGLKGMRERVRALGGTLHIDSAPGSGATVVVRIAALDAIEGAAGRVGSLPID
jgi:PAS domain S-box-containing protein